MCRKIRCDGKSCKVLGFLVHLNKALATPFGRGAPLPRGAGNLKALHTLGRVDRPGSGGGQAGRPPWPPIRQGPTPNMRTIQ